jgi:hypothetical protein
MCKSLINKALLKLTALNKVFLSAVVLCLALLSAPVALAAETPKLNSGSSIDGNEMLLMAIAPSIRPPLQGISPGPARQASVMNGKMGRTGGAAEAAATCDEGYQDDGAGGCESTYVYLVKGSNHWSWDYECEDDGYVNPTQTECYSMTEADYLAAGATREFIGTEGPYDYSFWPVDTCLENQYSNNQAKVLWNNGVSGGSMSGGQVLCQRN